MTRGSRVPVCTAPEKGMAACQGVRILEILLLMMCGSLPAARDTKASLVGLSSGVRDAGTMIAGMLSQDGGLVPSSHGFG